MTTGIILYVHGARDARWAEPFRRLRAKVEARGDGTPVALAFLEHGTPDLAEAAAALAGNGVRWIRIVPMFFGRGGHLRDDLEIALRSTPQSETISLAAVGEETPARGSRLAPRIEARR